MLFSKYPRIIKAGGLSTKRKVRCIMMKQKIIAALLLCAMTASLFSACAGGGSSSAPSSQPSSSQSEESAGGSQQQTSSQEEAPAGDGGSSESAAESAALNSVVEAVKEAYGDSYLPSMQLTQQDIADRYGLNAEDYTAAVAEVAMISTQVDTFVAVEAKEGKAETVKAALESYRDSLVNDSMQYPMNVPKVNASQVYQNGNYVFFLMLGDFAPDDMSDDEEASLKFYQEQNQIAVKAIDEALAG